MGSFSVKKRWLLRGLHWILVFSSSLYSSSCALPSRTADTSASARNTEVLLATTTSLQDSGLLDRLGPLFQSRTGYTLKPISVGTGAALAMGARGDVDVLLVHAPEAESAWMKAGHGTTRQLVMYNDFVIVGPSDDPAGIKGQTSATTALARIADAQASWVSRGDASGTHQLEQQLWAALPLVPEEEGWYLSSGQGMGMTLTLADQKRAYTLTDRGTYLALAPLLQSRILFEGDPILLNLYHVMPVKAEAFPAVELNTAGATAFVDFLLSPEAQETIASFGIEDYGQPLFMPAAGQREEELRVLP